jgi:hypothetical protein
LASPTLAEHGAKKKSMTQETRRERDISRRFQQW